MANPKIKVKRSSVAGKVPAPTQLERGELAVNSYDGKVYIVRDQFSTGIGTTTHTLNPWDEYTIGNKIAYAGIASAQQFDGNITGSINSSGISTFGGNITADGNITIDNIAKSLRVGNVSSDNYLQLIQISNNSTKRGFITQHSSASVFENLQGSTTQHLILGDSSNNNSGTIFGISHSQSGASHVKKLNLTGEGDLDVQRNITLGGTVDGRDIATDGTKLDTIESNATADQTASEILSLLSDQNITTSGTINVAGNLTAASGFTLAGAADLQGALDVDGATTLDALTVDEESTFNADIEMVSTDSSSSAGPVLSFWRNSSSPADADYLGQLKFQGENSAGQKVVYSKITGKILDASDGTEDGIIEFAFQKAGSNNISGRFRSDSLQLLNGTNFTVAGDSTFTGRVIANHGVTGNINSAGISTISGFTFPSTDGSEDQALVTDGNGSLSFKTLSGGGGGATGAATTISTGLTTATAGQTSFTAPNVFDDGSQATAFSVQVFLNGVKQRVGASNDYVLSAPQTVTFNSGVPQNKDEVTIVVYFGHTLEEELFTATEGQKTFTLAGNLAAAKNYKIYLNGVKLRNTIDYQASSAVVLNQITQAGDNVDICSDQAEDRLIAVQNQTAFAPSDSNTTADNMQVYLNGLLLRETEDWTIGSPAITILDADGLTLGDHLDVVVRRS